ncbi:DUF7064 domain-containing protein [Amycolatopsis rubida]|uniref:DUF7064 domain-containing protein n=1 Tax=Amycolatopsis rubida TaxID=112413 RepID=A0A1I5VFY0_9PSEU|nr:hypothetical protein [Amycolatopsis rubida]SFQ06468.1 hypothetical protein SAMN05421854_108337 [Amycolatopsis rubida]
MIRPEDAQFHPPTSEDPLWAETNYFGLYAGQDTATPVNIGVYGLFREPLGVAGSTVSVNSKRVTTPWSADYWDAWEHLALPKPGNLLHYELANGLTVDCVEPNQIWDVAYTDPAAQLDLRFRFSALMEPYDINDPGQDPLAAGRDMDLTWGHAYAGHFDLTGRVEGEISLRGDRLPIDCVSTMDHSWGVRAERQTSRLSWLHAHFSPEFAVHALFDFTTGTGPDAPGPLQLTHGYVLDHGEVHGLKAGEGTTWRSGFYPERVELRVTDSRDETFELRGSALTTFPWQAWPGTVGHNSLHRWTCDGATGYGEIMDFIGLGELGAAYNKA